MTLILDGDFFYPLRNYKTNTPILESDLNIPNTTWDKISNWQNKYTYYTPLNKGELEFKLEKVKLLDIEGIELVKEISKFVFSDEDISSIDKIYYFSICFDKLLFVLYRDGTFKKW